MTTSHLWRYTSFPALFYLLSTRTLTLLDPKYWDDTDDFYFLDLYRKRRELKTLLALCFTQTGETYHHWRVFADGPSGVCIRFNKSKLIKALGATDGIRARPVVYRTLDEIGRTAPTVKNLPFLKRAGYIDEDEFRIIYESAKVKESTFDIPIPLSSIDRITLSPWLPAALARYSKETIRTFKNCNSLRVVRSTLIGNRRWKEFGESAT